MLSRARTRSPNRRRAAYWIELILVLALAAALIGVAVPFFQDNLSESCTTKARQDLEVLRRAWLLRQAREPVTRGTADLAGLNGGYLQELPRDPWGNEYLYDPATNTLRSHGADVSADGSGADQDIVVGLPPPGEATWFGGLIGAPVPATASLEAAPTAYSPPGPGPVGFSETRFTETRAEPLSTFALDVDTGSYTLARRFLRAGQLPAPRSVRVEEFVNALSPTDPTPTEHDFALTTEVAPGAPGELRILRVALRARSARQKERERLSLTFLIDVSGSMRSSDRLGLVKRSLTELAEALAPTDQVALVSFATDTRVHRVLAPLGDGQELRAAIDRLAIRGGTDLGAGLARAYEIAEAGRSGAGTHRVVLCSDGATNTGITDPEALLARIAAHAKSGVMLTTLGFGMGGFHDQLMEQLADRGNGNYAYLDTIEQARKVLVEGFAATLLTVARDARIQVVFAPEAITRYRLLGYENRAMAKEDFRRDDVDAGEVGPGQAVTALYEVALVEGIDPRAFLGEVHLRWYPAGGGEARELREAIRLDPEQRRASRALARTALAAAFAEALRLETGREEALRSLARRAGADQESWREDAEMVELLELIASAAALTRDGEATE